MDAVAHAVAEPNRRAILRVIRDDERSVGEIAQHFDVTRPAISQHLKVLHDARLVTVRADGNRRLYRARPEGLAELRTWMEQFWRSSLATLRVEVERDIWQAVDATDGDHPEPSDDSPDEPTQESSDETEQP